MHRLQFFQLGCCVALAFTLPVAAGAQTPASPPQAAAPQAADTETETRSLFDESVNQFIVGGRVSHIDGDPARFQRYQDLRDGVVFTNVRFGREDPGGSWLYHLKADNVGYRDQRYSGVYEHTGKLVITGLWDEIPQFYSVDTKTPYTGGGGTLLLDDAT